MPISGSATPSCSSATATSATPAAFALSNRFADGFFAGEADLLTVRLVTLAGGDATFNLFASGFFAGEVDPTGRLVTLAGGDATFNLFGSGFFSGEADPAGRLVTLAGEDATSIFCRLLKLLRLVYLILVLPRLGSSAILRGVVTFGLVGDGAESEVAVVVDFEADADGRD